LNAEILILKEQKVALQDKICGFEKSEENHQAALVSAKADYDERLRRQDEDYNTRLASETDRIARAQVELKDLRTQLQFGEERLRTAVNEAGDLQAQLKAAQSVPQAIPEDVDALKAELDERDLELKRLSEKAKTIEKRYNAGELVWHPLLFLTRADTTFRN